MQFVVLGSHPKISLAEINAVTGQTPVWQSSQVAIFDNLKTELTGLQKQLAGTQKIGHIIGSIKPKQLSYFVTLALSNLLENPSDKKIIFGLSFYDLEGASQTARLKAEAQKIGLTIKKELKNANRVARFVTSKEPTLSSVVITKNHLLQNGAEFVLLVKKDEILIGQTVTVQDFEDWSGRDFGRPARDAWRGMLPPKLARIMVNLTGTAGEGKTLLDPFCGSGTILMEAGLSGFTHLIGSDLSPEAVEDTKKNLAWLKAQNYSLPECQVIASDATKLTEKIAAESIEVMVTEPYLGKPRRGKESQEQIEKMIRELSLLYKNSFAALKKLMKPKGILVIASPIHYLGEESFTVPTEKILTDLGFQNEPLADEPLIYRHEDQFVGRQLLKFSVK